MNGAEKAHFVSHVFNHIAKSYDHMNMIMTWGMLPRWQKKLITISKLKPGDRALDVCCGTGELALLARKRVGVFGEIVGIDFSDEMLEAARHKADQWDNLHFVFGDALDINQPNRGFQAVVCGFALRNVSDIPKAISEMARVTAPGGRVVCMDVSRPIFPPARFFFNYYYYKVVPWLGDKLVSRESIGNMFSPYAWLAESLRHFPNRRTICRYYKDAELINIKTYSLGFGAVTIYCGEKGKDKPEYAIKESLLLKLRRRLNGLLKNS